jgi:ribosome-binding protein aMBF1 (putative translation factor)
VSGRHPYAELRARRSPEARKRAEKIAEELGRAIDLADLRRARDLSQEELAQALGVEQPAIAKMEKRTDMYVSSLRRFIEAMGGQLRIVARFAGRDILIQNFSDLQHKQENANK